MSKPKILDDRFWSKVQKSDGCWIWQASRQEFGHGLFRYSGKLYKAHRLAYEDRHGPIPVGLIVRHKCDNPPCVNLDHLEIGTRADNNRDRDERGRHVVLRGEDHGKHILTEEAVREIRRTPRAPGVCRLLADKYGVALGTIYNVRSRSDLWTGVA
jgi:hypothetical protein